jgi:hypothetical protein
MTGAPSLTEPLLYIKGATVPASQAHEANFDGADGAGHGVPADLGFHRGESD